jgi:hypothetical protein
MVTRQRGRAEIVAKDHDSCYWMSTVLVKENNKRIEENGDSKIKERQEKSPPSKTKDGAPEVV